MNAFRRTLPCSLFSSGSTQGWAVVPAGCDIWRDVQLIGAPLQSGCGTLVEIGATITWLEPTKEAGSISQGQQPAQHPCSGQSGGGEEGEDAGLLLAFGRVLPAIKGTEQSLAAARSMQEHYRAIG